MVNQPRVTVSWVRYFGVAVLGVGLLLVVGRLLGDSGHGQPDVDSEEWIHAHPGLVVQGAL